MNSILNINLSAARGKDEDFTTYKDRLKLISEFLSYIELMVEKHFK